MRAGIWVRTAAVFAAWLGAAASATAAPALSVGCAFVNAFGFPVVWTNQLGGSFSPTQPFNAGEVISVQASWTGGPSATGAVFHVTAKNLAVTQNVAATGVLATSYTLPADSTYIDVGIAFSPTNVGRGNFTLTVSCQAAGAASGGTNRTDSARLAGLVRGLAPAIAHMSARANIDLVFGNIDALLVGADSPRANDTGFRLSSFGALAYAGQAAAGGPAGRALEGAATRPVLAAEPPLWNVWAAGRYTGASGAWQGLGSARGGNFVGGLDRRFGDRALFGLFAGYEEFRFWNGFDLAMRGTGPSVGPYLGVRITDVLTLNALAGYTSVGYRASAGLATAALHADRWTFAAGLTARLRLDEVRVEPQAKLQYLTERQNAYVDSLGTYQASAGFAAGRASLGARFVYLGFAGSGPRLTPWVGVYGDLGFGEGRGGWLAASMPTGNGPSARTSAGLDATFGPATLALSGEYGGIGAAWRTVSGRGTLRIGF